MTKSVVRVLMAALVLGLAGSAFAVPIVFSGVDAGAGSADPRPNANAANAAWSAAVGGGISTVTFESGNTGSYALTGDHDASGLKNSGDSTLGYNTTPGGNTHLGIWPTFGFDSAAVTFNYATPIYAWGAFITGLDPGLTGSVTVSYVSSGTYSFPLGETTPAGIGFFGFVDVGAAISAVTLTELNPTGTGINRDIWGIDDIQTAAVPEPTTLLLLGGGIAGLALRRRRRV